MALLTADDVLNKKFQPTKFREGYDQDEVDDFLDEVVNTLRAVYAENEELKTRIASLQSDEPHTDVSGGYAYPAEPQGYPEEEASVAQEQPEAAPAPDTTPAGGQAAVEEPAQEATPAAPAAAFAAADGMSEPESATGVLQLAQRLHDEYVNDGKAEAERLVSAAREESERLTSEAEELRNRTLNQLEEERTMLERKIDELRGFERDYRVRLKSYLEGLLRDVEGPAPVSDPLSGPGNNPSSPPSSGYDLR